MDKIYLMKCGHVSQGTTKDGKPVCAICFNVKAEATEIDKVIDVSIPENRKKGLEGRKAKCSYCNKITDSAWDLPFFNYKPDQEYDSYYDGCFGWD